MGRPKKVIEEAVEQVMENVKDEASKELNFDGVDKDIALIDEGDKIESEPSVNETLNKLANSIANAIEKKAATPKQEPAKKPFKLGFWGYLGLVVVVKGAVEITRAVTGSKRNR